MISLSRSSKAQSGRVIMVGIVFLFVFGILTFFGALITRAIISGFQTNLVFTPEMTKAADGFLFALNMFDGIIVLIMVVFIIGVAITSFRLAAHPIGFIVTFIMAAFYGLTSYILSYVFQNIISDVTFAALLTTYPITILICTNLHWVALANVAVGAIALYAKKPKGQFLT